jgi:hypothetical protein
MANYSFLLGLWKSLKNTTIVFAPAILAGWAAFESNVPTEYAAVIAFTGGFLTYLLKNYIQVKRE